MPSAVSRNTEAAGTSGLHNPPFQKFVTKSFNGIKISGYLHESELDLWRRIKQLNDQSPTHSGEGRPKGYWTEFLQLYRCGDAPARAIEQQDSFIPGKNEVYEVILEIPLRGNITKIEYALFSEPGLLEMIVPNDDPLQDQESHAYAYPGLALLTQRLYNFRPPDAAAIRVTVTLSKKFT